MSPDLSDGETPDLFAETHYGSTGISPFQWAIAGGPNWTNGGVQLASMRTSTQPRKPFAESATNR